MAQNLNLDMSEQFMNSFSQGDSLWELREFCLNLRAQGWEKDELISTLQALPRRALFLASFLPLTPHSESAGSAIPQYSSASQNKGRGLRYYPAPTHF